MLLKDLVWRSALRRGAGETEVGSLSPQVFEVTDLLIPEGTDWSAGHAIHSFALPARAGMVVSLALDIASPLPAAPERLVLAAWGPELDASHSTFTYGYLSTDELPGALRYRYGALVSDLGTSWNSNHFVGVSGEPTTDDPSPVYVGFQTAGGDPPSEDITVVRACASFLVI